MDDWDKEWDDDKEDWEDDWDNEWDDDKEDWENDWDDDWEDEELEWTWEEEWEDGWNSEVTIGMENGIDIELDIWNDFMSASFITLSAVTVATSISALSL